MNRIRIGLVGLVVLTLTGVTAGGANAATGRGTAAASITLLDVQLGNIQNIKVLTDEGQGTLDPTRLGIAGPRAFGELSAVTASGALNLRLPDPLARAEAPGTTTGSLDAITFNLPQDVTNLAGGAGLPALPTGLLGAGVLASGVIDPIKVEAFTDAAGARAAVGTEVPNVDVLQGLISVKNVKVGSMSASATTSQSQGDTGVVTVGDISVLDLGSLLGAIGVPLGGLPLDTLTGLVQGLGLPVDTGILGLGTLTGADAASLLNTVSGLGSALSLLQGAVNCDSLGAVTGILDGLDLEGILGTGGLLSTVPLLDVTSLLGLGGLLSGGACDIASASNTVTGALGVLDPVLDSVFGVLDSASLIQLSGVEFSALAKAAETLAGSSASTTANFGTLKVGGLSVGDLDLNATVAQVTSLVDGLESTLKGVLSPLGLGDLIDIGIMERTSSVKAEGAYNVADAGLNVLRVTLTPPAVLSSVLAPVANLQVGNLLSGILNTAGAPVLSGLPVVGGLASGDLAKAFGLTSLLSQPTTIKVGAIRAQSDFTTAAASAAPATPGGPDPAAPGVTGQLPRTGSNNGAWMAALAALALAGAFGITRQLRKPPVIDEG
ncbi:MAG: LPXTG cell wall anchor domain-containing protein [Acidimicrobiia bacterium]